MGWERGRLSEYNTFIHTLYVYGVSKVIVVLKLAGENYIPALARLFVSVVFECDLCDFVGGKAGLEGRWLKRVVRLMWRRGDGG